MIYIVETTHEKVVFLWNAKDKDDFISEVKEAHLEAESDEDIIEVSTVSEIYAMWGFASAEEASKEGEEWLADLYRKYGWNFKLYRSDMLPNSRWQPDPIDEYTVHAEWLKRNKNALVYCSKEDVEKALREQLFPSHLDAETSQVISNLLKRHLKVAPSAISFPLRPGLTRLNT